MASHGIQAVLAIEVAQLRPSAAAEKHPRVDTRDAQREPNLGRGANRQ
jgi:hypothetical protein